MRASLTLMTKTQQSQVEAEAVDVGVRQVKEQMFLEKMTYSRKSSRSKD